MEDRLDEIIEEVVKVRKEFGYPVMATPYSQIVGAQAVENVISGKRYEKITDEAIKYVLGYYGEPVIPVDEKVRDRVMELPRTRKFEDWKPEGYLKSVEELREETSPGVSDDELLLEVIIPGGFVKRKGPKPAPLVRSAGGKKPIQQPDVPMEYSVDVDGETFNVRISPVYNREEGQSGEESSEKISRGPKEILPGSVIPNMAGMLVSLAVEVGQVIEEGDLLGTIEAMKMMRDVEAPHGGVVQEIYFQEGEMIEIDDVFMIVGTENE